MSRAITKPLVGVAYDVSDARADVIRALYATFGTKVFSTEDVEKVGLDPNAALFGSGEAALARVLRHIDYARRDLFRGGRVASLLNGCAKGWFEAWLSPTELLSLVKVVDGWRVAVADLIDGQRVPREVQP